MRKCYLIIYEIKIRNYKTGSLSADFSVLHIPNISYHNIIYMSEQQLLRDDDIIKTLFTKEAVKREAVKMNLLLSCQ